MKCIKCGQDMEDPHFCEGDGSQAGGMSFKIDLVKVWKWWKKRKNTGQSQKQSGPDG